MVQVLFCSTNYVHFVFTCYHHGTQAFGFFMGVLCMSSWLVAKDPGVLPVKSTVL